MRQNVNDFFYEQGGGFGAGLDGLGAGPCDAGFTGPLSPDEAAACADSATPSYSTVSTASGDYQVVNGQIFNPAGQIVNAIPSGTVVGGGISTNTILIGFAIGALVLILSQRGRR